MPESQRGLRGKIAGDLDAAFGRGKIDFVQGNRAGWESMTQTKFRHPC